MFKSNSELIVFLKAMGSEKLKEFNSRIIPTNSKIIGIKTPDLRVLAKKCAKEDLKNSLAVFGEEYHEEILLYGLIVAYANVSYDQRVYYLDKYVKLIDNWAQVDCVVNTCKFISKNRKDFLCKIEEWLSSGKPFVVRFALVSLLYYYIDDECIDYIFKVVENIDCSEYYVSMAVAWLLAECYVKLTLSTENYLKISSIDAITYNRTIQKICDSYRVDKHNKIKLKLTKRKM